MELKIQLNYSDILLLVRQLSASQLWQLREEISEKEIHEKAKMEKQKLRSFYLSAPVMSDEEMNNFPFF